MIIFHSTNNSKCLSTQIYPAIKRGWKDNKNKNIHFFWGWVNFLNHNTLKEIENKNEEWWFIDNGYLTKQITRYPNPIIHNYDKTYFRICKMSKHTKIFELQSDGKRRAQLKDKKINCDFPGWKKNRDKVLLCPSSEGVTQIERKITQKQWCDEQIKKLNLKENEISFRNKPRPENKWWNTSINDELKESRITITFMSLVSVDSILQGVPVICDRNNVANILSSKDVKNPLYEKSTIVNSWLDCLADNQFTLDEISNGTAYQTLEK